MRFDTVTQRIALCNKKGRRLAAFGVGTQRQPRRFIEPLERQLYVPGGTLSEPEHYDSPNRLKPTLNSLL